MDYFFLSTQDEEAKDNPMIAMVDESTGEKYARAAGKKGAGTSGEMDWLLMDMADELKSWGHTGGNSGHIIMKSDNEYAIKAVRDAVGKLLGGRVIPENPPKGESQSNGRIEEAGKTIRGFVRVMKSQIDPPFLRGTSLSKIHNRAVGYRTSPLMTQTIVINNSSSLFKHHTVTLGVANTIDIRCLC